LIIQVDAGMSVLSDQVDGRGDRTDEAVQRPVAASRSRFAATAASLRARWRPMLDILIAARNGSNFT
jgi:hypothetical protein